MSTIVTTINIAILLLNGIEYAFTKEVKSDQKQPSYKNCEAPKKAVV